jgi:cyclase
MRKLIGPWVLAAALFTASVPLPAQATPEVTAVLVSGKVFLVTGLPEAGNVAFLVTDQGVLVVDSGAGPSDGEAICRAVREKTDQPIRLVVLTHSHGDHIFGLQSFPPEALVIAQENLLRNFRYDGEEVRSRLRQLPARIEALKAALAKLGKGKKALRDKEGRDLARAEERLAFYQRLRLVPPHLTFTDKLAFRFGGEAVEIIFPGPAHIDDNLLVYFPDQKVIHMGDILFRRYHPYIDRRGGSDTANWIKVLQDVQELPLEKVIPGHGEVAGKEALAEQARYLTDLRAAVAAARQKGLTPEQAKKGITLPDWKELGWPELLPEAIEAVYGEMGKK